MMTPKLIAVVAFGLVSGATTASGAPPSWAQGSDSEFSQAKYVVGVGTGSSEESADISARAEVSRVFESQIKSVMKDFQSAATAVNNAGQGVSVEVQAIEQFQQVVSSKTLQGVEISRRAKDGATHYALATLSRQICSNSSREQVKNLDAMISGHLRSAQGAGDDKLKAYKHYGKALDLMDERESLNSMYRICANTGQGIKAPVTLGELASQFEASSGALRIGLMLVGFASASVRDCLLEQLGDADYEIEEIYVTDEEVWDGEKPDVSGFDAVLDGRLRHEVAGKVAGSVMVRASLTLKLYNPKTNKTLKTFRGSRKEGRRNLMASVSLASHKICKKETPKIVKAITKYFK